MLPIRLRLNGSKDRNALPITLCVLISKKQRRLEVLIVATATASARTRVTHTLSGQLAPLLSEAITPHLPASERAAQHFGSTLILD